MEDYINRPRHYITGGIECIDVLTETQGFEAVKKFARWVDYFTDKPINLDAESD